MFFINFFVSQLAIVYQKQTILSIRKSIKTRKNHLNVPRGDQPTLFIPNFHHREGLFVDGERGGRESHQLTVSGVLLGRHEPLLVIGINHWPLLNSCYNHDQTPFLGLIMRAAKETPPYIFRMPEPFVNAARGFSSSGWRFRGREYARCIRLLLSPSKSILRHPQSPYAACRCSSSGKKCRWPRRRTPPSPYATHGRCHHRFQESDETPPSGESHQSGPVPSSRAISPSASFFPPALYHTAKDRCHPAKHRAADNRIHVRPRRCR